MLATNMAPPQTHISPKKDGSETNNNLLFWYLGLTTILFSIKKKP